jgi:two-component system, NarL family, sensor histidine kinase UhpB
MQQGISDIVWAVKPDNDKIENIVLKMKEYSNQLLEPKNIAIQFSIKNEVLLNNIAMQQRRDVLLIYKEAIHNIAKYAHCTLVTVGIDVVHKMLLLTIKDNGNGFDINNAAMGNGIKNMRQRTENLQGYFEIQSAIDKGTTVMIRLPQTT